jgi:hypothetical protein
MAAITRLAVVGASWRLVAREDLNLGAISARTAMVPDR